MNTRKLNLKSIVRNIGKGGSILAVSGLLLTASTSYATWQPLERSGQKIGFNVVMGKKANQLVNVTVPGFNLQKKTVDGKTYTVVKVPDFPGVTDKGNPDVPRLSTNLLIPNGQAPTMKVVSTDYVDIPLEYPLLSSKGHFTRDINPETVPYTFSDTYQKDEFYPNKVLAEVSEPFTMHNVQGVNANFNFFQYNPVKQVLRVYKNVTLSMENSVPEAGQRVSKTEVPSFLASTLSRSFINFGLMQKPLDLHVADESGSMLVICYDDFTEAAKPWVDWKKKSGIPVKFVKMSEVGSTAEDIKNYVQEEFDKGGLSFLHLIGDVDQIPTLRGTVERAHSDQSYGLLAGDDWFLDIIVSRFSAQTAEKVALQVDKAVKYESAPDYGDAAAWYKKGIGIASNEGNPKDWDYANTIRDGLMAFTYDEIDQIYDPTATASMVTEAINDGRSVINYIGHGSKTSWVSSRFNTGDIAELNNGRMLPYIWSVACVNGAFASWGESFAEAWLNAGTIENQQGAIAVAAASTNMQWVPPLYWQAETNLVLLTNGTSRTFGGLSLGGMSKIAEKYGATSRSFKMFVEQTNNFGDGSIRVRYDAPNAVEVEEAKFANGKVSIKVGSPTDADLGALTVTVYNKDMSVLHTAKTDTRGLATFDVAAEGELFTTVTGTNLIPVVDRKIDGQSIKRESKFDKLHK